jgi:hypothetical protein
MRYAVCSLALFLAAPAFAQAPESAEAVVKKAVAAHGGADKLDKLRAGESKLKGEMSVFGMDLEFTGSMVYQLPDKFRLDINTDVMGQKLAIVQVANGSKLKNTVNGMATPLGEAEQAELKQAAMMQEVTQLTPLLEGKKYTLKLEKDADVDGKPAHVVLVTAKDFKDTRLYFDAKSGLLVKTERKGLAPSMGEPKEVTEETLLSDYKKVDGVMVPMKMIVNHDGKKFMTMTVTEAKLMEKADAKTFAVDD